MKLAEALRQNRRIIAVPKLQLLADALVRLGASDPDYYQYRGSGVDCDLDGQENIQGPEPFDDKSNVAVQFFVFGDTPYDKFEDTCYKNCEGFDDCWENGDISTCNCGSCGNKCTYQGNQYDCIKDYVIPYMNDKIDAGDAAFIAHCGDILGELMGV